VLLYELLTGTTPFDKERLQEVGFDELRRIIREEEPPKPSTRISTLGQAATTVSTNRQSGPKQLCRLCRGELDWIVMKALEKDRNRRYETANGFAQDIQRYLADEPVLACPPAAWYRFRKFARRNKSGLAVAGLVLFFIVLFGAGGGWVLRDRAAREQHLASQVEMILDEVDRLEREQKWPEAQAAAKRAEAALAGGEAGDAVRQRLGEVVGDLTFVAGLDRIWQDLAMLNEGDFNYHRAARDYALAFREYGVDLEALPAEEAVARLQAKPALALPVAAALDGWAEARRRLGKDAPSSQPLVAVARVLDPHPLRDRLRASWGRPVTPELQAELRQLAESIDVKAESPATLEALALSLHRSQLHDAALRIMRDGQYAHPDDFWLTFDAGTERHMRKDYGGAVRYYSAAVSLRPRSAAAHNNLGYALSKQGKVDEAIAEFRKAIELGPDNPRAHGSLGCLLCDKQDFDGALTEFRKVIAINSNDSIAHYDYCNLGLALRNKGDLEGAVAAYRKAVGLAPKSAWAHYQLGYTLQQGGDMDGACVAFRKAIALDPKFGAPHNELGKLLVTRGDLDGAIAEFREAIRINPDAHWAHCNLGHALKEMGKFRDALVELRRGHELGSKDPGFRSLSADWVRQCERLLELDPELPDFLDGKRTPASPAERVELAGLCSLKHLNRAAALFYEEAFGAKPALADDLDAEHRYNAACAAALAGCGQGKDARKLDEQEKARWRGRALDWLRADLGAMARLLDDGADQARTAVGVPKSLRHWQADPDLAGVRGAALARLPQAERQAWQKLWDDAADMLARAQAKTTPEKKPDAK
jgi:serine/threonine-protein kinase